MPTMAWPAISQRNVVLAGVALALNVLLVIAAAGLGAIYWLPFAAGPAALFAARESPGSFRILAAAALVLLAL